VTNAKRHARSADRIRVSVRRNQDSLLVSVHDNGARVGNTSSGHGLTSMAERVKSVGGTFAAGPKPDGGWQVRAELPFTSVAAR